MKYAIFILSILFSVSAFSQGNRITLRTGLQKCLDGLGDPIEDCFVRTNANGEMIYYTAQSLAGFGITWNGTEFEVDSTQVATPHDLTLISGSGDDWGTQVVETTSNLSGDGTVGNELNVLSAPILTTPRTIAGTSFDGSANIDIDHGSLIGLGDDDHSQYALLAGRSGSQTLYGGTSSNDDLHLFGTSHSTKTSSYISMQSTGGNVGIGISTPSSLLEIYSPPSSFTIFKLSDGDISLPNYSALFTPTLTTQFAMWATYSGTQGGMQLSGFTESGVNNGTPAAFLGYHGGTSPTTAALNFIAYKHNGATSRAALSGTELIAQISNGIGTPVTTIRGDGNFGILTTAPDAKFEVNMSTSGAVRYSYNDADGSAATYTETTISSTGEVTNNAVGSATRFIFSDRVNIPTHTPANSTDTGTTGDIAWDANYIYICVATDTWERVAYDPTAW